LLADANGGFEDKKNIVAAFLDIRFCSTNTSGSDTFELRNIEWEISFRKTEMLIIATVD